MFASFTGILYIRLFPPGLTDLPFVYNITKLVFFKFLPFYRLHQVTNLWSTSFIKSTSREGFQFQQDIGVSSATTSVAYSLHPLNWEVRLDVCANNHLKVQPPSFELRGQARCLCKQSPEGTASILWIERSGSMSVQTITWGYSLHPLNWEVRLDVFANNHLKVQPPFFELRCQVRCLWKQAPLGKREPLYNLCTHKKQPYTYYSLLCTYSSLHHIEIWAQAECTYWTYRGTILFSLQHLQVQSSHLVRCTVK
jgi:hypothetical protein